MDKIKIEDLSIGDWVQDKNGKYAQILGIENWSDGYVLNVRINGVDVGCVPASSAHPIPITPEILEKNGFVKSDAVTWYSIEFYTVCYLIGRKYWDASIKSRSRKYRPTRLRIDNFEFVHQLQHALRFAGVDKEITL